MLYGAAVCAARGEPLGNMHYVVLIKGVLYVTVLPLSGAAGAPFRALGKSLLDAMLVFADEELVGVAPARVRNVPVPLPDNFKEALAAACAGTTETKVTLVEPQVLHVIREAREAASVLPAVDAADDEAVLTAVGVPPAVAAVVAA